MPSWAAVVGSMTATCWAVSFSYALSGGPATIDRPIAATAPGEAARRLADWETVADSASGAAESRGGAGDGDVLAAGQGDGPPPAGGGHPVDVVGDRIRVSREADGGIG